MKKILSVVILMICGYVIQCQNISILTSGNDQNSYIRMVMPDTTYYHQLDNDRVPEYLVFDDKYMLTPNSMFERADYDLTRGIGSWPDIVEPGCLPEGDLPYKIEYTPDGQKLVVICHHSNNVYIYDMETLEPLGIVNIGVGPEDFALTEDHLYVCCYYSDEVYVISMEDYSIRNIHKVDPQPSVIKVNNAEEIIYIGFDTDEHFKGDGYLAAFALSDFHKIWENSWVYISQINMWEGWIGRRVFTISDFILIGDDQYILSEWNGGGAAIIIDAITGELVTKFSDKGNSLCYKATESKDSVFLIFRQPDSVMACYCIDSYTHQVLDSIIDKTSNKTLGWAWQDNAEINSEESKVFFELDNIGSYNGTAYLFDFSAHELKEIEMGEYDQCTYQSVISFDGRYVIIPETYSRIFDLETEEYVYDEFSVNNIISSAKVLASSPVEYKYSWCNFISNKGITNLKCHEKIDIYDFADPSNVVKADSIVCGIEPEADLICSAAINNQHNKIITANTLSGNISIIDANIFLLDTLIDIKHISVVKCVNDDLVALSGDVSPNLYLFDLTSLSIVKEFNLEKCGILIPSPDKQYLYTYSRGDDCTLAKIRIDGINSTVEKKTTVTELVAYYTNCGYTYEPEITPDGKLILFHDDYSINLISTNDLDLIASVTVSGKGVYDMAFTEDSKRVCIAYWYNKNFFDIIYLDGANSFVENTVYTLSEEGGMSVEFNTINKKFYYAKSENIWIVDPATGKVEDTIDLDVKDPQIQIGIDIYGNPIVNTLRYLYYNGKEYHTREPTAKFFVDNESKKCIIPSLGPDRVYIIDFLTTDIHVAPSVNKDHNVIVYPNPASEAIKIESGRNFTSVEIFNSGGKLMYAGSFNNTKTTIDVSSMPDVVYFLKVEAGEKVYSEKLIISNSF